MWIEYNPNPIGSKRVGDCAVRAVAKALKIDWETAYLAIMMNGYYMGDVMSSDVVWNSVLRENGFYRKNIPNKCPVCFTVREFAELNPIGTFVLGTGHHAVTVSNGDYYDTWDSGDEIPIYVMYDDIEPIFGI